MSRFLNRNFELLEPYDAKVSCTVLRGESLRKGADLLDKEYYDRLKSVHDLVKDAKKVRDCILLVGENGFRTIHSLFRANSMICRRFLSLETMLFLE